MPGDMDQNKMAEQLVNSVKNMVDPNAPLEQQLCQMRAQLAALAQLPCVIQQSLELLTRQLSSLTQQESHQVSFEEKVEYHQVNENTQSIQEETNEEVQKEENDQENSQNNVSVEQLQSPKHEGRQLTAEEYDALKKEEEAMLEEQRKSEKMKKEQQEARIDQDSRQVKQRAPRVGKPKKMFGPLGPEERPLVLPGGRRWRGPKDAYNEQMIAEMMQAQSEVIQGKVLGINFMKFEKPPVSLDHLQKSETYKMVHDIEQMPMKRVELLTPVVAESDYRERCRSATPRINTNGYP